VVPGEATGFADDATVLSWQGARLVSRSKNPGLRYGYVRQYRFDSDSARPDGARTTRWNLADGTADTIVASVSTDRYTWSGDGRLLELHKDLGEDGTVDELYRYDYDADGNMVRLTTVDAQGAVVKVREYDYVASERLQYNRWLRIFAFFL